MGMMQEITNDYVYLDCGPLFHIATFMTTMATFHFGGTNVFTPRVEAEELCRLIQDEGCTGAFIMGPTIGEILELNKDDKYRLKTLRTFGGAPAWNEMITVDTSPWARKPAGFGQTEVMGMLTLNAWGGDADRHVGPTDTHGAGAHRRSRWQRGTARRSGRDHGAGTHRHERVSQPARAQRPTPGRRLASHQRSRQARARRLGHVRRAQRSSDQVRGREHLSRRSRGLPPTSPGRERGGRHRHPRQEVGPERESDHRPERRRDARQPRSSSSTAGRTSRRTRSREPSSSSTRCRATVGSSTTTRWTSVSAAAATPAKGVDSHEYDPDWEACAHHRGVIRHRRRHGTRTGRTRRGGRDLHAARGPVARGAQRLSSSTARRVACGSSI